MKKGRFAPFRPFRFSAAICSSALRSASCCANAGYAPPWAFLSSLVIYAGSGQYLLVSLLAANASLVTVAVMTLLLNCRHIFTACPFLKPFTRWDTKNGT